MAVSGLAGPAANLQDYVSPRRESPPGDSALLGVATVLIVAGKGGVGSSTVSAAAALAAARQGKDVLLVSVDGKPSLGTLLGGSPLTHRPQTMFTHPSGGVIRGQTIPPEQAFADYLDLRGVGSLMRRAVRAVSMDVVAASTPGLEHLLVLGKIKELERVGAADLIIVDAPPAGHATPFLAAASTALEAVDGGPLRTQAEEVNAMLTDPDRARVAIVTLPEETPVNEATELYHDLATLGISTAPLLVNGCWPVRPGLERPTATAAREAEVQLTARQRTALVAASRFGAARLEIQTAQLERLDRQLAIPRIELPRRPSPRLDLDDLQALATALLATATVPDARSSASQSS